MPRIVMACSFMAYIVMAEIVIACIDMAYMCFHILKTSYRPS